MKITHFSREACHDLFKSVDAALRIIGQEHGITLKRGRATFTIDNCVMKITAAIERNGVVQTPDAKAYLSQYFLYDLPSDGLGKTFTYLGYAYTIIGLRPRSRRYPVITTRSDGRVTKFPAATVRGALLTQDLRTTGAN